MIYNDEFKQLRRYGPWEVVKMLNLKETRLKRRVTAQAGPQQRSRRPRRLRLSGR